MSEITKEQANVSDTFVLKLTADNPKEARNLAEEEYEEHLVINVERDLSSKHCDRFVVTMRSIYCE